MGGEKGLKKLVSRFSNRANFRTSRKVSNKDDYFNPFIADIDDSSLVTINMGVLNTFYFNRTNTKFGADYIYQDNRDKSLLTKWGGIQKSVFEYYKNTLEHNTSLYLGSVGFAS